jgi:hypothetical protein
MNLNYEEILEEANVNYLQLKIDKGLIKKSSLPYMAPELIPTIGSDQVKAMLMAIISAINEQKS